MTGNAGNTKARFREGGGTPHAEFSAIMDSFAVGTVHTQAVRRGLQMTQLAKLLHRMKNSESSWY